MCSSVRSLRIFGTFRQCEPRRRVDVAQEKRYNPYYTLVLNQLCTTSHSHRFTFQYALWDFLRSLEEGELGKEGKRRAENLAKTVAFLIGRQTVDITVLKVGSVANADDRADTVRPLSSRPLLSLARSCTRPSPRCSSRPSHLPLCCACQELTNCRQTWTKLLLTKSSRNAWSTTISPADFASSWTASRDQKAKEWKPTL